MNFFEKLIYIISSTMEKPSDYGWFHLFFIILFTIITFVICFFYKDASHKTFKIISIICLCIMIFLETYKQIVLSCSFINNNIVWNYNWYNFPFQLCSSPLYILPFVIFIKKQHIKEIFISFLATFSLFGGLVVFIYPNDVFISIIGVNIQTMIHHGLQITLGIFYLVYYRNKLNITWWKKSIIVFINLVLIAILLNISMYYILQKYQINDVFNMYFISPFFSCTLPILSTLYNNLPYILFILLYIFGFVVSSFLIYYLVYSIINLLRKAKKYFTN